jgi:hypothetical protein
VSKCKLDTPAVSILRSIVALLVFNAAQEHHARGVVALGNISFQFNMEWFACFKAVQGEAFLTQRRKYRNLRTRDKNTTWFRYTYSSQDPLYSRIIKGKLSKNNRKVKHLILFKSLNALKSFEKCVYVRCIIKKSCNFATEIKRSNKYL